MKNWCQVIFLMNGQIHNKKALSSIPQCYLSWQKITIQEQTVLKWEYQLSSPIWSLQQNTRLWKFIWDNFPMCLSGMQGTFIIAKCLNTISCLRNDWWEWNQDSQTANGFKSTALQYMVKIVKGFKETVHIFSVYIFYCLSYFKLAQQEHNIFPGICNPWKMKELQMPNIKNGSCRVYGFFTWNINSGSLLTGAIWADEYYQHSVTVYRLYYSESRKGHIVKGAFIHVTFVQIC